MLEETLKQIVPFDDKTLGKLTHLFEEVHLKKGTKFAEKGEYSRNIAFVRSGVLRAYRNNFV